MSMNNNNLISDLITYAQNGDLERTKKYYEQRLGCIEDAVIMTAFIESCKIENYPLIEWFLTLTKFNVRSAFIEISQTRIFDVKIQVIIGVNFDVVKHVHDLIKNDLSTDTIRSIFIQNSSMGDLKLIKLLWKNHETVITTDIFALSFLACCSNGYKNIAEWLFSLNIFNKMDVEYLKSAYETAKEKNNTNIVEWFTEKGIDKKIYGDKLE